MAPERIVVLSLPDLISFQNDSTEDLDDLYQIYLTEIHQAALMFRGLPVQNRRHPEWKDKVHGFWHIVKGTPVDDEREPILQRCERIRWIPWIINNAYTDSRISCWPERRDSKTYFRLWLEEESYIVILEKRREYYLLVSGHPTMPHKNKSLLESRIKFLGQ